MTRIFTPTPIASLTAVGQDGCGLRVEFLQLGNQFAHRILAFDAENTAISLLETVETLSTEASWPPSPVLQGLNTEDLRSELSQTEKPLSAMLMGSAGKGHWSLSIEPRQEDKTAQLLFDVACRVKSLPTALTSTYTIGESVEINHSGSALRLRTPLGDYCLEAMPLDSSDSQNSCQLHTDNGRLQLSRETLTTDTPPITLRWCYQLSTSHTTGSSRSNTKST